MDSWNMFDNTKFGFDSEDKENHSIPGPRYPFMLQIIFQ